MKDDLIPAAYNPATGTIGCVNVQAGMGGNSAVAHLFGTEDWETAPKDGMALMRASADQWRFVASLSREERVRRFKDHSRED